MNPRSGGRFDIVVCAAFLALLIPLFWAPALTDYRISDDFRLVGKIDFAAALPYFHQTAGFGNSEYRPLVLLSFALDNYLWGGWALGYHLTNILLHAANGVLLLFVLYWLTGSLVVAFFAASLFSFHPVHHSRVAWIAARDGSISTLFLLISFLTYLSFRSALISHVECRATARPPYWKYALSAGAFLLALMSYEGAVVYPLVLVAAELFLARQSGSWTQRIRQAGRITLLYFVVLASYMTCWYLLLRGNAGGYDLDLTLAGMGHDFLRLHNRLFYHIDRWLVVIYLGIAALLWRQRKAHHRLISFSMLLIWIVYLPFLPLRGYASRFAYFSCIGAALLLSLAAVNLSGPKRKSLTVVSVLPSLLLLILIAHYGQMSMQRLQYWVEAGRISESIPTQLKDLEPTLPPESTLIFDQIPAMHYDAYVYITSFPKAVQSKYSPPPRHIHYFFDPVGPSDLDKLMRDRPAFYFRYLPGQGKLVQIAAREDR